MLDDVLAIPDQLRDALWRVDSARLAPGQAAGLAVCGMGGSAIGGDLAAAALGPRLEAPLLTVRGYELPAWLGADWTVLCSSYSGNTEETLACFAAAGERGCRRIVASTGGALVDRARQAEVPVVGLPGIFQPRAAVAYMFVIAAEVAALTGVAPRVESEIEAAAAFLTESCGELRARATEIVERIAAAVPVVYGGGLTAPVARRWATQADENAKLLSFHAELPEADHNQLAGWSGGDVDRLAAIFLADRDQHPRLRRRFELTADAVESSGAAAVVRLETEGEGPIARLLWATMLGDLVSLALAEARGVDALPVEAIERFKQAMGPVA